MLLNDYRGLSFGVSACLLGELVRYDGGHKRYPPVADLLARHAKLVPVCPEAESGLGVPRPTIQLVQLAGEVRMIQGGRGIDCTEAFKKFSKIGLERLLSARICGFIAKSSSPSCALDDVPVYTSTGGTSGVQAGLFTAALKGRQPALPIETEKSLEDPFTWNTFVTQSTTYHRLQNFFGGGDRSGEELWTFHQRHEAFLLAYVKTAAELKGFGPLFVERDRMLQSEQIRKYTLLLLRACAHRESALGHHAALAVIEDLAINRTAHSHRVLLQAVMNEYKSGALSITGTLRRLREIAQRGQIKELLEQFYLFPGDEAIALRREVDLASVAGHF